KNHRLWIFVLIILLFIFGQIETQQLIERSGNNWINSQSSIITKWLYSLMIIAFAVFSEKFSPSSRIELIGANSYGIYLSHVIIVEICARMIYHLLPYLLGQSLILLGILMIVGITTPMILMFLSRKIPVKPIYAYIWG
ncbi:MAG: hypothetical protein ACK4SN_14740, partial [Bellilinea sp.]